MKWINLAQDRPQLPESCRRDKESSHFTKAGIFLKKKGQCCMELRTDQPVSYAIVADMSTISSGPATDSQTLLCDQ